MDKKPSEIMEEIIRNSIWKTPSVAEQPSITLIRWSVKETTEGERHFVGYNLVDREGRTSTAIQSFDPTTARGVTASGRVYQLVGPAGYDSDGSWVWDNWAHARGIESRDVTDEFKRLQSEANYDPDYRFGITAEQLQAAMNAHAGIMRMGLYVPTRAEVAGWPSEKLHDVLLNWMYESPSELIPNNDQIAEVLVVLEARPDADRLTDLITECRKYIE